MDTLRKPLFWIAAALLALAFAVELGAGCVPAAALSRATTGAGEAAGRAAAIRAEAGGDIPEANVQSAVRQSTAAANEPPGLGIGYLSLLDGLLLYTVVLIGLALVLPERIQGRVQGVATLLVSLSVLVTSFFRILAAFALLMVMVTLLLAVPFGTIVYVAKWGFFPRGTASAILGTVMALKLGFAACLIASQQQFLRNGSLVRLLLTSLLASIVVSFLQGFVPGLLVSIADAIAALVVGILALVWALVYLVRSIPAIVKALRVDRAVA
jgi:hypothetical protein